MPCTLRQEWIESRDETSAERGRCTRRVSLRDPMGVPRDGPWTLLWSCYEWLTEVNSWLVVWNSGLEHDWIMTFHILGNLIPTDIFQRD